MFFSIVVVSANFISQGASSLGVMVVIPEAAVHVAGITRESSSLDGGGVFSIE